MYLKCLTFQVGCLQLRIFEKFCFHFEITLLAHFECQNPSSSGSFFLITNSLTIAATKEDDGERWSRLASYLGQITFPVKVRAQMSVYKFLQLKHAFVNKSFFSMFDSSENFVLLHYRDHNCFFQHFKNSKWNSNYHQINLKAMML